MPKRQATTSPESERSVSRHRGEHDTNTVKETLKLLLRATSEASDAFPPLKSAASGLKFIVETFEKSGDNLAAVVKLQRRIEKLIYLARRVEDDKERRLALTKNLDSITDQLRFTAEQSTFQRLVNSGKHADLVREFIAGVDETLSDYQLTLLQDAYEKTTELMAADDRTTLNNLSRAKDAGYNGSNDRSSCLEGTRVGVLEGLQAWADDPRAKQVYWLNGHAGSGKSTIAQSFAEILIRTGELGASFFCSRDSRHRSDLKMILPTIAYQLSMTNNIDASKYRRAVLRVLRNNPDIASLSLRNQLDELIIDPVTESGLTSVIIVDALDECSDPEATSTFLDLLLNSLEHIPSVKFLITSRPEPHIHNTFRLPHLYSISTVFVLHNVDAVFTNADIMLFLRTKLVALANSRRSDLELPDDWPPEKDLVVLMEKAGELFIFAATVVKLISSELRDPRDQLQRLTTDTASSVEEGVHSLDSLYRDILRKVLPPLAPAELFERLRQILGLLVVAKERMIPTTLATLLKMGRPTDIRVALNGLRSVLVIPDNWNTPIRFHHKSFPDFLTDDTRCTDLRFFVHTHQHDIHAGGRCLDVLNDRLKKNICGLARYTMNRNVDSSLIDQRIDSALRYCCRYWVDHLIASNDRSSDLPSHIKQSLLSFVTTRQVYWFECLGLLQELGVAVYSLSNLYQWLNQCLERNRDIINWVVDGRRFVLYAYDAIRASVAHIYHSALPLSPERSLLRKGHTEDFVHEASITFGGTQQWPGPLRTIVLPYSRSYDMKYSHDGSKLATCGVADSNSIPNRVDVYDSHTGELVMGCQYEGHHTATAVAFSPSDTVLTALCRKYHPRVAPRYTIISWDIRTGTQIMVQPIPQPGGMSYRDSQCVLPVFITYCSEKELLIAFRTRASGGVVLDLWDLTAPHCIHRRSFAPFTETETKPDAYILRPNAMPLFLFSGPDVELWDIDPPERCSGSSLVLSPGSISAFGGFNAFEASLDLEEGSLSLYRTVQTQGTEHHNIILRALSDPPGNRGSTELPVTLEIPPFCKLAFSPDGKFLIRNKYLEASADVWEIRGSASACPSSDWLSGKWHKLSPDGRRVVTTHDHVVTCWTRPNSQSAEVQVATLDVKEHFKLCNIAHRWPPYIADPLDTDAKFTSDSAGLIIHDGANIILCDAQILTAYQTILGFNLNVVDIRNPDHAEYDAFAEYMDLEGTLCCARSCTFMTVTGDIRTDIEIWVMSTTELPGSAHFVLSAMGTISVSSAASYTSRVLHSYIDEITCSRLGEPGDKAIKGYLICVKFRDGGTFVAAWDKDSNIFGNTDGGKPLALCFRETPSNSKATSLETFLARYSQKAWQDTTVIQVSDPDTSSKWVRRKDTEDLNVLWAPPSVNAKNYLWPVWHHGSKLVFTPKDNGDAQRALFVVDFSGPLALDPSQPF